MKRMLILAVSGYIALISQVFGNFWTTSRDVPTTAPLDQRMETEHFIFYFARGDRIEDRHKRELEIHYMGLEKNFGVSIPGKIEYYKYYSGEHKKFHTETDGDGLAVCKPANDIHSIYPNNIHEMTHIFAAYLGNPNAFLLEGTATAFPGFYTLGYPRYGYKRPRSLHKRVKQMRKRGTFIPLEDLLDNDTFWKYATDRSYGPAGSFVRFLIDRYGIEKFRTLYSTVRYDISVQDFKRTFMQIYEMEFSKVSEQWLKFIENN